MAAILYINGTDFSHMVSDLKVGKETLVSDNSGRNAAGDMVVDVINKKYKVYVTFRHTTEYEMDRLLNTIDDYVITLEFYNPYNSDMYEITAYTSTPEPEYYTISDKTIFKPMSLNFIEL
jgi:hypothetical protein